MPGHLAIIPARGGSKRLPRKNVLPFAGKPILGYSIEAAFACGGFSRVVVSTEDAEIAEVASRFGAHVDERPSHLAADHATVVEVCEDLLLRESQCGRRYEIVCCLYATAPLRNADDIARTLGLIEPGHCEFSMAVTRYLHYPHQALRLDASNYLTAMWPDLQDKRSEAIGELLAGNGSTYCALVPRFLEARSFVGPLLRGYEMPLARSIDIDTQEDFELALAVAKHMGWGRST